MSKGKSVVNYQISNTILTCIKFLLCAWISSKCFICYNSFNLHKNPVKWLLLLPLMGEETEAQ